MSKVSSKLTNQKILCLNFEIPPMLVMSAAKRLAGVIPEVSLSNPLDTNDETCNQGNPPWRSDPGQTSPEVQNRGISDPTKGLMSSKKWQGWVPNMVHPKPDRVMSRRDRCPPRKYFKKYWKDTSTHPPPYIYCKPTQTVRTENHVKLWYININLINMNKDNEMRMPNKRSQWNLLSFWSIFLTQEFLVINMSENTVHDGDVVMRFLATARGFRCNVFKSPPPSLISPSLVILRDVSRDSWFYRFS